MALEDAVIVLVALALPIWLVVEQVVWWISSKEAPSKLDSAGLPVEGPSKKAKVNTRQRPAFPVFPRKVS